MASPVNERVITMNKIKQYVDDLSEDARRQIIETYELYETQGFIGEAPVRHHARTLMKSLGIHGDANITMWMQLVAFECYRHFSHTNMRG